MFRLLGKLSLTQWILIAMVVGCLVGWLFPAAAVSLQPLSSIFIRMIQSLIAPLIFATLVIGIAGHGDDMKRVGRLALKSIIYFEIVTTLALVIGLLAVNLARPGDGVNLKSESAEKGQQFAQTKTTLGGVLEHIVPKSVVQAAASNEVLQIVFWSVLFAVAMTQLRGKSRMVLHDGLEALAEVMFKFTGLVMAYAPIGIGAAIAVTVGTSGLEVLWNLGKLILTLYVALVVFILVVLVPMAIVSRIPLRRFFEATKCLVQAHFVRMITGRAKTVEIRKVTVNCFSCAFTFIRPVNAHRLAFPPVGWQWFQWADFTLRDDCFHHCLIHASCTTELYLRQHPVPSGFYSWGVA